MNLISKVTLKNLLNNKLRNLVTITGIALAACLVFSVLSFEYSIQIYNRSCAEYSYGNWEVQLQNVSDIYTKSIITNPLVKNISSVETKGWAEFEEKDKEKFNNKMLRFDRYSNEAFKNLPLRLVNGKMPENEQEILLPATMAMQKVYSLGQKITFNVGKRQTYFFNHEYDYMINEVLDDDYSEIIEKSIQKPKSGIYDSSNYYYNYFEIENTIPINYTVTGFYKVNDFFNKYTDADYIAISALNEEDIKGNATVSAFISYNDPNIINTPESLEIMQNSNGLCYKNTQVLNTYFSGEDKSVYYRTLLAAVLILIILTGSILLIYNSVSVSVQSRKKQLGIIAATGATRRQLFNSVFTEVLSSALIGIPTGLFAGYLLTMFSIFVFGNALSSLESVPVEIHPTLSPNLILFTLLTCLLAVVFSTIIPAIYMSRISPVQALNNSNHNFVTPKKAKNYKTVEKLFGFEGSLALKNLKRNSHRYNRTVMSLVLSLVLFISASSTASYFSEAMEKSLGCFKADIMTNIATHEKEFMKNDFYDETAKSLGLEKAINYGSLSCTAFIDESYISETGLKYFKQGHPTQLMVLPDENFIETARNLDLDYNEYFKDDLCGIVIDMLEGYNSSTREFVEYDLLNEKSSYINLHSSNLKNNSMNVKIKAGYHTDYLPKFTTFLEQNAINIIIPESAYENAVKNGVVFDYNFSNSVFLFESNTPLKDTDRIQHYMSENNIESTSTDISSEKNAKDNTLFIINTFSYSFTIMMFIVTISNVFNTLYISLKQRRREFAVLRSVGMDSRTFTKIMWYESMFYGLKAILISLPIAIIITLIIYHIFNINYAIAFTFPFTGIAISFISVALIVLITFIYSKTSQKNINLIDFLRNE